MSDTGLAGWTHDKASEKTHGMNASNSSFKANVTINGKTIHVGAADSQGTIEPLVPGSGHLNSLVSGGLKIPLTGTFNDRVSTGYRPAENEQNDVPGSSASRNPASSNF